MLKSLEMMTGMMVEDDCSVDNDNDSVEALIMGIFRQGGTV
jgi:hypothetical protein